MSELKFPWEALKAETLRSLCRDIGVRSRSSRAGMIEFLRAIEEHGLSSVLQSEVLPAQVHSHKRGRPERDGPDEVTVSPSRSHGKNQSQGQDYTHEHNTRHRGKRARRSDPGLLKYPPYTPSPPSASASASGIRPRNGTGKISFSVSGRAAPKHARKFASTGGREAFDGVVLSGRRKGRVGQASGVDKDKEEGDKDAEGEADAEGEDDAEGDTAAAEDVKGGRDGDGKHDGEKVEEEDAEGEVDDAQVGEADMPMDVEVGVQVKAGAGEDVQVEAYVGKAEAEANTVEDADMNTDTDAEENTQTETETPVYSERAGSEVESNAEGHDSAAVDAEARTRVDGETYVAGMDAEGREGFEDAEGREPEEREVEGGGIDWEGGEGEVEDGDGGLRFGGPGGGMGALSKDYPEDQDELGEAEDSKEEDSAATDEKEPTPISTPTSAAPTSTSSPTPAPASVLVPAYPPPQPGLVQIPPALPRPVPLLSPPIISGPPEPGLVNFADLPEASPGTVYLPLTTNEGHGPSQGQADDNTPEYIV